MYTEGCDWVSISLSMINEAIGPIEIIVKISIIPSVINVIKLAKKSFGCSLINFLKNEMKSIVFCIIVDSIYT